MTARRKPSYPRGRAAGAVLCPGLGPAISAAGKSHDEVAAALKVARTTVSSWVGRGAAPQVSLAKVAKYLRVPLAEFTREPPLEIVPIDYDARAASVLGRVLKRTHESFGYLYEGEDAEERALERAEESLEDALFREAMKAS